MLDDDFTVDATLAEGGAIWSPPRPTPAGRLATTIALCTNANGRGRRRRRRAARSCAGPKWPPVPRPVRGRRGSSPAVTSTTRPSRRRRSYAARSRQARPDCTGKWHACARSFRRPLPSRRRRPPRLANTGSQRWRPRTSNCARPCRDSSATGRRSGGSTARLSAMLRSFGDCATRARRSGRCPRSLDGHTWPWMRPSMRGAS